MSETNSEQSTPGKAAVTDLILVVHGIRDRAAWFNTVRQLIEGETTRVLGHKYGYFSALRFLAPWDSAKVPLQRLKKFYDDATTQYPEAQVSVIAHSFGSYLVTRLMMEDDEVRLHRVLLCGCVVEQGFDWSTIKDQIGDATDQDKRDYIVNDCGNGDVWPVLAQASGWRYGNAGTDGFGGVFVTDRIHKGGHGLFFDKRFIRKYWVPYLHRGAIVKAEGNIVQGENIPWWIRLLGALPLRWVPIFAIALSIAISSAMMINGGGSEGDGLTLETPSMSSLEERVGKNFVVGEDGKFIIPPIKGNHVTFTYTNDTGHQLELWVFDWTSFYKSSNVGAWEKWPLKEDPNPKYFTGFEPDSSGWFSFLLRAEGSLDIGTFLGTKQVFDTREPSLLILEQDGSYKGQFNGVADFRDN